MPKELEDFEPHARQRRTTIGFVIRFIIGLGIIGFLIWRVDFTQIVDTLADIDPFWLILAVLVQVIGKFVWAWRWSALLEIFGTPVRFTRLVKAIYVGLFFGNFLPTGFGGDFYRAYWIVDQRSQLPKSFFVVFVERFIGLVTLGYIALPAGLLLLRQDAGIWSSPVLWLVLLLGISCGGFLLHPTLFQFLDRTFFPAEGGFLQKYRRKIIDALIVLHEAGSKRWRAYLLSYGVHVVGVAFFYCLGQGLGLPLKMWHYLLIVPFTVMATLLPLSFNGLGVREGALILLTAGLGSEVTPAQAIALGLLASIVILVVSLIGSGFYIRGQRGNAYAT